MRNRGLTEPIYKRTASSVSLVLSSADAVDSVVLDGLTKSTRKVLSVMRLEGHPLGTGQVADLAEIARPTANRALRTRAEAGLVRWNGTSDRDPRASWQLL